MRFLVQSLAAKKRFLQRRYFDFCSNLVFYPGSSASDKNTSFYFPISNFPFQAQDSVFQLEEGGSWSVHCAPFLVKRHTHASILLSPDW